MTTMRVKYRIEAAKQDGSKYRGKKPSYDRKALGVVLDMLGNGAGASEIGNATGLTRQTVLRIDNTPDKAVMALARWGVP